VPWLRHLVNAEARVRSRFSPRGIWGGQNGTGTGFSPSTSVFPYQFHSTGTPLLGKTKTLIIFITGLHNKPRGCGASVTSAAGPFTQKRKSPSKEISRVLPNPKFHNRLQSGPVLSQLKPIYTVTPYIYLNLFSILSFHIPVYLDLPSRISL
jgi:hypothetical protein